jgi:glycosyltransferase involved in cell wall biosynthesis
VRLAWVSPLPPTPSGIADYSADLLPLVAERAAVDVFCSPHRGRTRIPGTSIQSAAAFKTPDPYDAVFYHLGNNPFHEFVYRLALEHPDGVAVLHDFVLHHLIDFLSFGEGRLDYAGYSRVLEADHGGVGLRLADLQTRGVATDFEKFLFPLNGHVARGARGMVVHSHAARDRLLEVVPDATVFVIPHHAQPAPKSIAGITREEARARLELPQGAFLVGHFGFITRPKQPGAVLGGFAGLLSVRPDSLLLVVGENQTPGRALEGFTRKLGIDHRVRFAGYVDLHRFYLFLRAVDVVVNLRYPSAGETSGTYARALAEGKPTIVNNLGSFAEIPSDVSLKVEADDDQVDAVAAHLIRLAEDVELRRSLADRARSYAETELDPRRCSEMYLHVAREVARVTASAV